MQLISILFLKVTCLLKYSFQQWKKGSKNFFIFTIEWKKDKDD